MRLNWRLSHMGRPKEVTWQSGRCHGNQILPRPWLTYYLIRLFYGTSLPSRLEMRWHSNCVYQLTNTIIIIMLFTLRFRPTQTAVNTQGPGTNIWDIAWLTNHIKMLIRISCQSRSHKSIFNMVCCERGREAEWGEYVLHILSPNHCCSIIQWCQR